MTAADSDGAGHLNLRKGLQLNKLHQSKISQDRAIGLTLTLARALWRMMIATFGGQFVEANTKSQQL